LDFAKELEQKPICPNDVPPQTELEYELRRGEAVQRAAASGQLREPPGNHQDYELSAEERARPFCGVERKEISAEESWQIEYIPGRFERIQHVRKKYACAKCEGAGEAPADRSGGAYLAQTSICS
jgi:hypothetical protein